MKHIRLLIKGIRKLPTFYVLEMHTCCGKFAARQPIWWRQGMRENLPKLVSHNGNLLLVKGWAIRPAKSILEYLSPKPVF